MGIFPTKIDQMIELIANRRKSKGLTQAQIGKMMGISARTYQRKEAGAASINEILQICKILDLHILLIPKEQIS